MKIAVNTRLLLKNKLEGLGWFAHETLKRITTQHPEHEFIFIFDRPFDQEFIFSNNITPVIIHPQARHPLLFYIWFEYAIPRVLTKYKADLFLSPDGYLSLSSNVRSLDVIHDLNFEYYPKDLPWLMSEYYQYFFPKFAHKATRIATVSEYSKQDLVNLYDIPDNKIDVVYNGVNESYVPISEEEKFNTRKKYTVGNPYFVFIGSMHPRKNIANLFRAFDLFRKKCDCNVKLVMVGEKRWWTKDIRDAYHQMKHLEDVIFKGRLSNEELNRVIGSSLAMTYISTFEGFGIPILEAFNCDIPVITSNVTSMPEVAADGALLIDPFSIESISNAMLKITVNETLRKRLIEKARIRKQEFSWQKTSDRLWQSIQKTMCSPI